MPGPTFHQHCPHHGYGAAHVNTSHGPRCIKCINERRAATQAPDAVLTFEYGQFVFRGSFAQGPLARAAGFHWQDGAWRTRLNAVARELEGYADESARQEFRQAAERIERAKAETERFDAAYQEAASHGR